MVEIRIDDEVGFYYECPECGNKFIEFGQNYCQDCGERIEWRED